MTKELTYDKFKYLYPPRPEYKCPAADLDKYDTGEYLAQPKYNGSACVVFTNGKELEIYNRHKERMSLLANYKEIEFRKLAITDKWFVFAGEYLNKGKIGETGVKQKNQFILWDVLVWDGKYLVGETLEARLSLMENILPCQRTVVSPDGLESYKHICCTQFKGIYKAPTYTGNFKELYDDVVKTPLYKGLVLKKKDSKLEFGLQEINNHTWQIKCRKAGSAGESICGNK